jgi:hypothetical protein
MLPDRLRYANMLDISRDEKFKIVYALVISIQGAIHQSY